MAHARGLRPGHEGAAGELWPLIGPHGLRVAPCPASTILSG
jgi:hypothetical protein